MAKQTALQKAISHCRLGYYSAKIADVVPIDFGVGITFTEKGKEYKTLPRQDWMAKVRGEVTSWRGISICAIHYYGKLRVFDPDLEYFEGGKRHVSSIGGAFKKPNEAEGIEIEVVRKLTQEEINEDPDRWDGYRVGDETNCWEDEDELIKVMKHICKHRFKGWKIELEDNRGRKIK